MSRLGENCRRWTAAEDRRLRQLKANSVSGAPLHWIIVAASEMCRSIDAVRQRCRRIGLSTAGLHVTPDHARLRRPPCRYPSAP